MRRLMLLRHAKTENDAPSGRDRDRRLDARGHVDASAIGGWIARHPPFPDTVLVSPATRAHQTWEIAWEAMKGLVPEPVVELVPDLYGAEVAQSLDIIRTYPQGNPQRLMLVGHNPGMHELTLALIGSGDAAGRKMLADNMPTSGFAIIDFEIDGWAELAFRRGRLVQFVSPKLLKQPSGD